MKTMKIALSGIVAIVVIYALTACSGIVGGDTTVRVSTDSSIGSRYVSGSANYGYVGVLQGNKVYSVNELKRDAYYELVNGNVVITNLPPGDYIFGVALVDDNDTPDDTDDDDSLGIAIKEVTIKKGFNDVPLDVGPGINTLTIGGADFSDFFTPDGYGVSFREDTIILDTDALGNIYVEFSEGYGSDTIAQPGGTFISTRISSVTGLAHQLTILIE